MKKYVVEFDKITKSQQELMKKHILKSFSYNKISDEELNKISKKTNIDSKIIISYRNQLIKDKVIFSHYKIINNLPSIIKDYNNMDILQISKKYDFSPMSIMRLIIKEKYPEIKLNKNNINDLKKYDSEQVKLAELNDMVSNLDQGDQQLRSENYEEKIAHYLDSKDIKYVTQESLVEEQKKTKGHAYATPDFLLEEKIIINDNEVKWLEVKNFYGTNSKFTKKKIQKQVDKYYKKWGFGCLIFRYAIYENLHYDNCLIISF